MKEEKIKKTVKKSAVKVSAEKKAKTAAVKKAVKTPKAESKMVAKEEVKIKTEKKGTLNLTVDLLNIKGEKVGKINLPKEIFGAKIDKKLLSVAVRVYLTNQRQGDANTKTRGEVDGSTRKIYRQKGTGRARHGGVRAPIFVKGGIAHGPRAKDFNLTLPKKMKKQAFFAALSSKLKDNEITILDELVLAKTKTKIVAEVLEKIGFGLKKRSVLLVLPKDMENIFKATRNLSGVDITTVSRMNVYETLVHRNILLVKDSVEALKNQEVKQA